MPINIHIPRWIEKAHPDYFTLFIQSWIPYNAWYHKEIVPVAGKTDRACIDYICSHDNTIKDKIVSLLKQDDKFGRDFRFEIAELQRSLMMHTIYHNDKQINFSTVSQGVGIAQHLSDEEYYQFYYKVERITSGNSSTYDIVVEDRTSHVIKYSKHVANGHGVNDVKNDVNYQRLNKTMQKRILMHFNKVDPSAPYDVVLPPDNKNGALTAPKHCLVIDNINHIYFVNDADKVAQILIRLIYWLRCELFHGSIDPTLSNQDIFEHLYKIQSILIKELV